MDIPTYTPEDAPVPVGEVVVERSGVESTMLKVDGLELSAGDRVTLRTGGGGGFGAPAERSAQAVEDDLIDGYTQEGGER